MVHLTPGTEGVHTEVCVLSEQRPRGAYFWSKVLGCLALQGAPETGQLYMEPLCVGTLLSVKFSLLYKPSPPPPISSHTKDCYWNSNSLGTVRVSTFSFTTKHGLNQQKKKNMNNLVHN